MTEPIDGGMHDAAALDDRALLAAHVAGDATAFDELVRRHRDRLWSVARRTLSNPEDAADAVQDGLISAYRAAGNFRGEASVTTWLHRITVNACLDVARRRASRPTVPLGDRDIPAQGDGVERSDVAMTVVSGLKELPIEQATAIVLVDIEGFGVSEAAEILEIPQGTVKSRCARGRARLAELLAGNDPVPPHVRPDETDIRTSETGGGS